MSKEISICSIVPYLRHWRRTYGHYRLQPGSPEKPSYLIVSDAKDKYMTDMEKGHFIMVTLEADKIVTDMIRTKELDQGFFVCEGAEATAEELETAVVRQRGFYVKLVRQGDAAWAKNGKHENVSDAQRRAAHSLGVQKDWNTIAKPNIECPSCGELVPVQVAMCKFCRAIINREAYDKLEFAGDRPSQAAAPETYQDLSAKEAKPELHESHRPTNTEPLGEETEA